jgi:hypothetical protein
VRLTDAELKHQEMFRRLETMMAPGMPAGYRFRPQPNDVAGAVLGASTWAVLALTCDIELFSQARYRSSIEPETQIDPLWKDVFLCHWKEESQHAILDEMEWLPGPSPTPSRAAVHAAMLQAYRWQYIVSGAQDARFLELLGSMINAEQGARIHAALAPIAGAVH